MAGKTCEEVLNSGTYTNRSDGKKVTRDTDNTSLNEDSGSFFDGVMRKVDKLDAWTLGNGFAAADYLDAKADALYNFDCSDHLLEWLFKVCPELKAVGSKIDNIVSKLNGITTGVKIGELVQNNSVTKSICSVIEITFAQINAWLQMVSKAAFALFDKIDACRERLQSAMKSLTDAVMECILDVYRMIEQYLTKMVKLSLNFEWDAFEHFLMDCPCICRFVAFITRCDKDDNGNNISDRPDLVIRCIRDKYWFIDGINLATGLATIMNDYIQQYIILFFDLIKLGIDALFTLIITPLRYLIKQYARLLKKKWDLTFMIAPMRASHLDCLLIYTKEKKNGETKYYMSIIDMMESMKMWVGCLEYPCAALSERIKNRVKKFNEEMRLTGEYWKRAFEYDIYLCCFRAESASDDIDLDDIAKMWSWWYDRLLACNDRAKNKMAFVKYDVERGGCRGLQYDVGVMRGGQEGAPVTEENPVKDAAMFDTSPDRENDINIGDIPLSKQEDELIRLVGISITEGFNDDPYFVEKWYQYLRFLSMYSASDTTVNKLKEAGQKSGKSDGKFAGTTRSSFETTVHGRQPLDIGYEERGANYSVESDYDKEHIEKIYGIDWKPRGTTEKLSSYYARMYASVG